MRKLQPLKAVSHALKSVLDYRAAAIRFGLFWIPLLFVLGLAEYLVGTPDPAKEELGPGNAVQLISAAVGLIGFCSMAVSWHRFILRDELGSPTRVDAQVWRYLGNSLLIVLIVVAPVVILALILAVLPPILSALLIPVSLLAGTVAMRLSIKLPAVALGRKDFTFRDAWAASDGNFWQIAGVFVLNAAIVLGIGFAFMAVIWAVNAVSAAAAPFVALIIASAFQLFYTMFNAGIFTSLYGFFVEKRDY